MKPSWYIKLNAGNDTNGNPRRVFVVFDEHGSIYDAIDEGYAGDGDLKMKYPGLQGGCTFDTSPAAYRQLLAKRRK